jgi:hypothetical protein
LALGIRAQGRKRALSGLAAALFLISCGPEQARPPDSVVVWKPIGSWSGRGDKQTETFTGDTGGFRVHWETTREAPSGGGRLRVVFRSGDSGREIIEAIDARGDGGGTEEVAAERPRWYYITIESANVDWKVSVDERIEAQVTTRSK